MNKTENNRKITGFALLMFALLTILMIYPLIRYQRIGAMSDWLFHASRVEQIYDNLRQGTFFTYIATNYFQGSGMGSFLFYPTIFMYPWVGLRFIFSPVTAFYIWYGIVTLAAFIISYWAMEQYSSNPYRSFIFSLIYTLCAYRVYLGNYVFGEFLAMTFLPILFLGLYESLYRNSDRWYLLAVGMALVAYCHILSVFLCVEILTVLCALKLIFGRFSWQNLIDILKAAGLALLLVLPVLVPFATDYVGHGIVSTFSSLGYIWDPSKMFANSLANSSSIAGLGIVLLLVAVFGWYFVRENKQEKIFYITGVVLLLVATSLFPWQKHAVANSFFATVQMPWRYLAYASFFLAVTGSLAIAKLLRVGVFGKFGRGAVYAALVVLTLLGLGNYNSMTLSHLNNVTLNNALWLKKPAKSTTPAFPRVTQVGNQNYAYQFMYKPQYGATDYYPAKARAYAGMNYDKIAAHQGTLGGRPVKLAVQAGPNKLVYPVKAKKAAVLTLPAIGYAHSRVLVDGRQTSWKQGSNGLVSLKLPSGRHKVTLTYKPSPLFFVALAITVISWIGLIVMLCFERRRKSN